MRRRLLILSVAIFTVFSINSASASDDFDIVQVEKVQTSSLSIDTSKAFKVTISATLISNRALVALNPGSNLSNTSVGIGCGHSGDLDARVEVTELSQDKFKFICEITDTPLSKSMPTGMQEISILLMGMRQAAVIPKSNYFIDKEKTDDFGTKTSITFPVSAVLAGWGNMNFYPRIVWTFGLAVNPPNTYVFPKFPLQGDLLTVFESKIPTTKTTYTLNAKKRTLNVKCPSSTPTFPLGGAKTKVVTRLVIGKNIVGGPSWNFNFPGVPGETLNVSCATQTVLTNHSEQIVGYSESAPVKIKFPK